ncbi:MAG TPA: phasin family protein, partial [Reyranella sp.]|nr:phasin family protein [Reyranella sp.]
MSAVAARLADGRLHLQHGPIDLVIEAFGAAAEVERAVARRSAEGAGEVGRAFAELVREQARDNLETFRALTGAFDWERVARVQAEFVRASLERATAFARRYLEVVQAVTTSAASATREQAE